MRSLVWRARVRAAPSKLGLGIAAWRPFRPSWPTRIATTATFFGAFGFMLCASPPAAAQLVQQGPKLVGTGATGTAGQGDAVALSGDGNTAIVGGAFDDANSGAAWVFTRSGTVWTQQGAKLVGTGGIGHPFEGG